MWWSKRLWWSLPYWYLIITSYLQHLRTYESRGVVKRAINEDYTNILSPLKPSHLLLTSSAAIYYHLMLHVYICTRWIIPNLFSLCLSVRNHLSRCVWVCVSISLCLSVRIHLSRCVWVCVSISLCLSVRIHLYMTCVDYERFTVPEWCTLSPIRILHVICISVVQIKADSFSFFHLNSPLHRMSMQYKMDHYLKLMLRRLSPG